tara:strand:+ start:1794 stop:2027 length:234 start_codon:yes stop_codon:yes gene_type:complete
MFAKLLPINIDERRISGLLSKFNARFAPFASLDKFRNLTLLDAIIPVSDPDENAEKINRTKSKINKKVIELVTKKIL